MLARVDLRGIARDDPRTLFVHDPGRIQSLAVALTIVRGDMPAVRRIPADHIVQGLAVKQALDLNAEFGECLVHRDRLVVPGTHDERRGEDDGMVAAVVRSGGLPGLGLDPCPPLFVPALTIALLEHEDAVGDFVVADVGRLVGVVGRAERTIARDELLGRVVLRHVVAVLPARVAHLVGDRLVPPLELHVDEVHRVVVLVRHGCALDRPEERLVEDLDFVGLVDVVEGVGMREVLQRRPLDHRDAVDDDLREPIAAVAAVVDRAAQALADRGLGRVESVDGPVAVVDGNLHGISLERPRHLRLGVAVDAQRHAVRARHLGKRLAVVWILLPQSGHFVEDGVRAAAEAPVVLDVDLDARPHPVVHMPDHALDDV